MMKTIVTAGFIAAALAGAPTAAADINISGINIGNQGNAHATVGNVAIAGRGSVATVEGGVGNVAVAFGGRNGEGGAEVLKTGPGSFNLAAGFGQGSQVVVDTAAGFNAAVAVRGGEARIDRSPLTPGGSGNIVFAGRDATATATNTQLSLSAAFCGGTVEAQSQRIRLSTGGCFGQ